MPFEANLLQMLLDLAQLRQNALGTPINHLSRVRQAQLASAAFEEGDAPNPFSKAFNRWLTADCVIELAAPARVKLLSLITSQNSFRLSMSTCLPDFYFGKKKVNALLAAVLRADIYLLGAGLPVSKK